MTYGISAVQRFFGCSQINKANHVKSTSLQAHDQHPTPWELFEITHKDISGTAPSKTVEAYADLFPTPEKSENQTDCEGSPIKQWIDLFILHNWTDEDVEEYLQFLEDEPEIYR